MLTELRATKDNKVMKILGSKEIRHYIARTDKGELYLMLREGESAIDYRFVLDAVPVDDETNLLLKELFK